MRKTRKRQPPREQRETRSIRRGPSRPATPPPRRVAPPAGRNERALRERILEFTYQERFGSDFQQALRLYFGPDALQGKELALNEGQISSFQEWYIFDYVSSEGEHIIDLLAREIGPQLPAAQRQMLDDWRRVNRYRLFEVREVEPGVGVTVQDLLNGEILEVHDISSSYALHKWEVFMARPLITEGRLHFTGAMTPMPPFRKPDLLECARGLWEQYQAQHPQASLDDFYRDHSLDLVHCQTEIVNAPLPTPYTEEGHPISPGTARYAVIHFQTVEKRLDESEEFVYVGPAQEDESALAYVWLLRGRSHVPEVPVTRGMMIQSNWISESGESSYRSLGDIRLWADRLELSCMSKERLEAGKALLDEIMGRLLVHRGDTYQDVEKMLESAQPSPAPDIVPEVDSAIVHRVHERQIEEWFDTPVPALGGKSPREAARDPAMWGQIDELLKVIEYMEEQNRREGRPYVDVEDLRWELGLPPVGS